MAQDEEPRLNRPMSPADRHMCGEGSPPSQSALAKVRRIVARPLTPGAFAPFGDVIDVDRAKPRVINGGATLRYHALGLIDIAAEAGQPAISVFRSEPYGFPVPILGMERHPFGSQAFFPLDERSYLVVVACEAGEAPGVPQAFLAAPKQGVNYARNIWHHPLLALSARSEFLVVDGNRPEGNLQTHVYREPFVVDDHA